MLDLSNNILNKINDMLPAMVPFSIIAASIIGSIHCVGMCGGLAMTAGAQSRKGLLNYHLGRLLGYFSVGALAGFLGSEFINSEMKYISLVSTVFLSISFLVIGFNIMRKGQLHIKQPAFLRLFYQNRVGRLLKSKTSHFVSSFFIGLLSPLLPCGWLYGFILIAVATNNPLWGGVLLTSFWIGTLPALSGISLLVKKPIKHFNGKASIYIGIFLMFIGISSLILKLSNLAVEHCCH
ncbi:sulfite exporter TauE/SafE family protein [Candidatus Scalindua japonica]|uniref:sulfite exporter TauE/SafE family protein n=1 Tax=Candidatus Scalindua japonica TaxID=1284222 RepID=UPI000BDE8113|nr:sulfite exporter TauE/SafE family protein [Candidatus Scalindua japonica]